MFEGSLVGKVLGALAGFLLYGPVGALFGLFAGHVLDRLKDRGWIDRLLPPAADDRQIGFTVGVVTLAAKMARVDGPVGQAELAAFEALFHIPPQERRTVGRLFDQGRRDAGGFEPYAEQLAEMFAESPVLLREILEALFIVGRADGPLGPAELGFLRKVAAIFGIGEAEFAHFRDRHPPAAETTDPYRVLGVDPEASDDDVKAAYRRLSRENHPDTLIAQGVPADFVARATRRMAAINAAYDAIRKRRG